MVILSILYFVFLLGLIVGIHEFGHFIVAKKNGVHVYEFMLGIGPKLVTFYTDKSGTSYTLRLFPIGGAVFLAGMDDSEAPKDTNVVVTEKISYNGKHPLQKIAILIAGPMMNFILTFVLLFGVFFFIGVSSHKLPIAEVVPDSPLSEFIPAESEIYITNINNKQISTSEELLSELETDDNFVINYCVGTEVCENTKQVEVTKSSDDMIGISILSDSTDKFNLILSVKNSFITFGAMIYSMILSIWYLVTGMFSITDLSGPVGIYTMSSQVVEDGLRPMILWIAYLSVNIGFLNLLPIPALDGGRIIFALYELIFRRNVPAKLENILTITGFLLLMSLVIFTFFNDIIKLFMT